MEVLDPSAAVLTNVEVFHQLKKRAIQRSNNKRWGKEAKRQVRLEDNVLEYLVAKSAGRHTKESLRVLYRHLREECGSLNDGEVAQILNSVPQTMPLLMLVVRPAVNEGRLSEEGLYALRDAIVEVLGLMTQEEESEEEEELSD
ncbi:RNA polymerase II, Rpb4 [Kipferlia bialata]|uniref:DNA-directed RNA polymerase III subunit RPC9 n=1 Tax=Kipferlia bialata TaxID=797122 RepID=A0A9K3D064_9EUKA|nr:RNA polymerase II, Rpb4 [Kipferlia bialata]|eukprot:g7536.t1